MRKILLVLLLASPLIFWWMFEASVLSNGTDIVFTSLFGMAMLGLSYLYVLPSLIALGRNRSNTGPIVLVNLILGWTVLGWILVLLWSISQDTGKEIVTLRGAVQRLATPDAPLPVSDGPGSIVVAKETSVYRKIYDWLAKQ